MKKTITFFNFGFLITNVLWLHWLTAIGTQNTIQDYTSSSNYVLAYDLEERDDEYYAQKLQEMGITLHPGTKYKPESEVSDPMSLNRCKSMVYKTLKSLPEEPVKHLKHLTLYFSDTGRRGLGGGNTIILRCKNVTDEELVGVLIHEMAHIMDTGVMQGTPQSGKSEFMDGLQPIYNNDASLEFYKLSFEDSETLKKGANRLDFVSGYAMTDAFEDFAESYTYYILHGTEFRQLAQQNKILKAKYEFLKTRVFNNKEYFNGKELSKGQMLVRHYDVTVLPYEMDKFLKNKF
jgi:hypothetical protein